MWLTQEEEQLEWEAAMRGELEWEKFQRNSMQRSENRRSRLGDVTRRYEIVYYSRNAEDTLHHMVLHGEKFSCVQELIYKIPYLDIYKLHDTLLVRKMMDQDTANVYHISDDFTVHWLGFVELFVIDNLRFVQLPYQYRMGEDEIRNAFRIRPRKLFNTYWMKPTTKTI